MESISEISELLAKCRSKIQNVVVIRNVVVVLTSRELADGFSNEKENEKPVAHPETEDSSFVDNIAEAMKLIEKMEKHLPLTVRPSNALVRMLRRQGIYAKENSPAGKAGEWGMIVYQRDCEYPYTSIP